MFDKLERMEGKSICRRTDEKTIKYSIHYE